MATRKRTSRQRGNGAKPGRLAPVRSDILRVRAVALLGSGLTVRAAARELGVHECTVSRWLAEPEVRERLEAVQADVVAGAVEVMRVGASRVAARVLAAALGDEVISPTALAACRDLLDRVGAGPRTRAEVAASGTPTTLMDLFAMLPDAPVLLPDATPEGHGLRESMRTACPDAPEPSLAPPPAPAVPPASSPADTAGHNGQSWTGRRVVAGPPPKVNGRTA